MLCKSPVNLTELAYIPLYTGMYLIMTMEPQNKTCTTISRGSVCTRSYFNVYT